MPEPPPPPPRGTEGRTDMVKHYTSQVHYTHVYTYVRNKCRYLQRMFTEPLAKISHLWIYAHEVDICKGSLMHVHQ